MTHNAKKAEVALRQLASAKKAKVIQSFFKTGKDAYGYGDLFLGIGVPQIRKLAQTLQNDLTLTDIDWLLQSPYHEVRMLGGLLLVERAKQHLKEVVPFYINHIEAFNSWDLVDLTAPKIVGVYLWKEAQIRKSAPTTDLLLQLADGPTLWHRRISIVATWTLIKQGELAATFLLAEHFLSSKEDLIQKATGWMLREAGKRDEYRLRQFLDKHLHDLPRTTLRYAIERFPESLRLSYLKR